MCISLTSCLAPVWQTLSPVSNPALLQQNFGKPSAPNSVQTLTDESPVWYLDQRKYVFAGIPQRIQLPVLAKDAEVLANNATIVPDPARFGYYTLTADQPNSTVTITIRNSLKATSDEQTILVRVLAIPMPEFRIAAAKNNKILAKDMRQLSGIELATVAYGANDALAIYCSCKSFQLTRLGADNSRETAVSTDGSINPLISALLQKAVPKDIYIFQQMYIQCSPKDRNRLMPNNAFEIE